MNTTIMVSLISFFTIAPILTFVIYKAFKPNGNNINNENQEFHHLFFKIDKNWNFKEFKEKKEIDIKRKEEISQQFDSYIKDNKWKKVLDSLDNIFSNDKDLLINNDFNTYINENYKLCTEKYSQYKVNIKESIEKYKENEYWNIGFDYIQNIFENETEIFSDFEFKNYLDKEYELFEEKYQDFILKNIDNLKNNNKWEELINYLENLIKKGRTNLSENLEIIKTEYIHFFKNKRKQIIENEIDGFIKKQEWKKCFEYIQNIFEKDFKILSEEDFKDFKDYLNDKLNFVNIKHNEKKEKIKNNINEYMNKENWEAGIDYINDTIINEKDTLSDFQFKSYLNDKLQDFKNTYEKIKHNEKKEKIKNNINEYINKENWEAGIDYINDTIISEKDTLSDFQFKSYLNDKLQDFKNKILKDKEKSVLTENEVKEIVEELKKKGFDKITLETLSDISRTIRSWLTHTDEEKKEWAKNNSQKISQLKTYFEYKKLKKKLDDI